MHTTKSSSSKFCCDNCSRSFTRLEHLKRHRLGHEQEKRFACFVCSKRFYRSDVLSRHEATHRDDRVNNSQELQNGMTTSSEARRDCPRACLECARAKAKCSKGTQCSRCLNRGLQCVYPERTLKRRRLDEPLTTATTTTSFNLQEVEDRVVQVESQRSGLATQSSLEQERLHQNYDQTSRFHAGSIQDSRLDIPLNRTPINQTASQWVDIDHVGPFDSVGESSFPNSGFSPLAQFPINWLPADLTIDLNYESILGLGPLFPEVPPMDQLPYTASNRSATTYISPDANIMQINPQASCSVADHISFGAPSPTDVVSPASHTTQSLALSPSSVSQTWQRPLGGFYTTSSDGARMPFSVMKKPTARIHGATPISTRSPTAKCVENREESLRFPDLSHIVVEYLAPDLQENFLIQQPTYECIFQNFSRFCRSDSHTWLRYDNESFPTLQQLNFFIRLYLEWFDPNMPFLHSSRTILNDNWQLAVAMGTLGCQYSNTEELSQCFLPMLEFSRCVLEVEIGNREPTLITVPVMQAMLLNHIGMLYSASPRLTTYALKNRGVLVELLRLHRLLACHSFASIPSAICWDQAIDFETKTRLGYSIWLLDSMLRTHLDQKPYLCLTDAEAPLPNERIWEAKSEEDWNSVRHQINPHCSLQTAVGKLYSEKSVPSSLGEFSRILLLQGIFHEIWEIERYESRPLRSWVPSAPSYTEDSMPDSGASFSVTSRSRPWLPGITAYSNWRNSALDCMDVLHWQANSTVALLSGREHSTVMHLHFARIALLVPLGQIQVLARFLLSGDLSQRQEILTFEQDVLQWARRDEHKARLAVLHAGALYWHLRRFSTRAFYEVTAIYLATLCIWAYSSYSVDTMLELDSEARHTAVNRKEGTSRSPSVSLNQEPTFIRLDRPCDDEIVQLFVRIGRPNRMRAHITGIGDIYSSKAPSRILKEGQKILSGLAVTWERAIAYMSILDNLEKATLERIRRDHG